MSSSKKESSKRLDPDTFLLDKQVDDFLFEIKARLSCHSDYEGFGYKQNILDAIDGIVADMREWYCD